MRNFWKKAVITLAIVMVAGFAAQAQAADYILDLDDKCEISGQCTPCDVVQVIVNIADMIVGYSALAALVMIIFGGAIMLTAWGNENRLAMGKKAVVAAVVGMFIIFVSWTVVNIIIVNTVGTSGGGGFERLKLRTADGEEVIKIDWSQCHEKFNEKASTNTGEG